MLIAVFVGAIFEVLVGINSIILLNASSEEKESSPNRRTFMKKIKEIVFWIKG